MLGGFPDEDAENAFKDNVLLPHLDFSSQNHLLTINSEIPIFQLSFSSGNPTATVTFNSVGIAGTAVPEPSTLTLLGLGIFGLLGYGWRRKQGQVLPFALSASVDWIELCGIRGDQGCMEYLTPSGFIPLSNLAFQRTLLRSAAEL